jgi:long-subunit acyl-CoA synthetase (AMP-forming)
VDGKRYYRTGDVVELCLRRDGTRHVTMLDRTGSLTKTATGKWVAPCKIEAVLEGCDQFWFLVFDWDLDLVRVLVFVTALS